MQAAWLATWNGASVHITALGDTAMPVRGDACRYRLGQENAAQQYQAKDEDSSHGGTVLQLPAGALNTASQILRWFTRLDSASALSRRSLYRSTR